jgi:serine protease Do
VVAIGHPEQGGLWTLTTGVISAEIDNFNGVKGKQVFHTETGLNRGNSGGPL